MDIDDEIDASGLFCPLPVLKARKRLKALPAGATLRLISTDPAAVIDVPHFCAENGHQLILDEPCGEGRAFVIRKAAAR